MKFKLSHGAAFQMMMSMTLKKIVISHAQRTVSAFHTTTSSILRLWTLATPRDATATTPKLAQTFAIPNARSLVSWSQVAEMSSNTALKSYANAHQE